MKRTTKQKTFILSIVIILQVMLVGCFIPIEQVTARTGETFSLQATAEFPESESVPDETWSEREFIATLNEFIVGRAIGFIPHGTNVTVYPDYTRHFDLTPYAMPPIRITVSTVKIVESSTNLGANIIARINENGTEEQTIAFSRLYTLVFDLEIRTDIWDVGNTYIGMSYSPRSVPIHLYRWANTPWTWDVKSHPHVTLPGYAVPSNYKDIMKQVARGAVLIEWNINLDHMVVPAQFINTTAGTWIRNDLFKAWAGVTAVRMGNVVHQGLTGDHALISPDYDQQQAIINKLVDQRMNYQDAGRGQTVTGYYMGIPAGIQAFSEQAGTWGPESVGTRLDVYVEKTNQTIPKIPMFDPDLGPYMLQTYTYVGARIGPKITEYQAKHQVYYGHVSTWGIGRHYCCGGTVIRDYEMIVGFTHANAWYTQEMKATLRINTYYDFEPNIETNPEGLLPPSDEIGDISTNIFGTGDLAAAYKEKGLFDHIGDFFDELFGLFGGFGGFLGFIIMIIVLIVGAYLAIKILPGVLLRRRLQKERVPAHIREHAEPKPFSKWRAITYITLGIIILTIIWIFLATFF